MNIKNLYIVIMAGGTGTRFWPYSRNSKPKQFLDVLGTGRSLLQMTYDRFIPLVRRNNIFIVSNDIYEELIAQQLPDLGKGQILSEPLKKNTAPCIAYASYKIYQKDPKAVMVVTPADHIVFHHEKFLETIKTAVIGCREAKKLITIGIKPHRPETGYGYIQYNDNCDEVMPVRKFTEKPKVDDAIKFLKEGGYAWNAGIFIWKANDIIDAFNHHSPTIAEIFSDGIGKYFSEKEKAFIKKAYSKVENISIDYAIIEKAKNIYMVKGTFDWSDLGSWNALHEIRGKDKHDNVLEADAILYNCRNNYIRSVNGKLVVISDLENYLIADFEDTLLICKKDDSSKFKTLVDEIKAKKGIRYL